jgi:hypothetical protein
MFRKNLSPPSSGTKGKAGKKMAEAFSKLSWMR